MRRTVLLGVCLALGLLLVAPATASAATEQQEITALQAAVATLQGQVAVLKVQVVTQAVQIGTLQVQVASKHAFLSGSGAPAAALGFVGDFYVNTSAWTIYGPKTGSPGNPWGSPTSLVGPKGATGATGAIGATGATGATGPQGPAGSNGTDGTDGTNGTNGTNGATWFMGSGEPSASQGNVGDLYLDTASGNVYQKASSSDWGAPIADITGPQGPKGDKGDTGATGEQGAAGPAGTSVTTGSGAPVVSANAGDLYLDIASGDLYEHSDSSWGAPISDLLLKADYPNITALEPSLTVDPNVENGVAGPNVLFHDCNVHVLGATKSGFGNLIVGPDNDPAPGNNFPVPTTYRSGSNNLVCGDQNLFEDNGGFVAGLYNTLGYDYATVSGGNKNIADNNCSSVSGGEHNHASGSFASVTGGVWNSARALDSSVTGGQNDAADGNASSVSGGEENDASGLYSTVSGGQKNETDGNYASISGGERGQAADDYSTISGGDLNVAAGIASAVTGGSQNKAWDDYSTVSGGENVSIPYGDPTWDYGWMAGSLFWQP